MSRGYRGLTMAGRFSISVPGSRGPNDPWFRIGTLDVTTTVLVILMCVASMFVWALEGPEHEVLGKLILLPEKVLDGQIWRIATWPVPNEPDIWLVIMLAIFWYFGTEVERLLGRVRFAVLLVTGDRHPRDRRNADRSAAVGDPPDRDLRVPPVRRRVPVHPLLLRHPRVGHRRRHPRHRDPAVARRPRREGHPVPVRRPRRGGDHGALDGPARQLPVGAGGADRQPRQRPAQATVTIEAVAPTAPSWRRRSRRLDRGRTATRTGPSGPLPQPPPPTGPAADQVELDALLDKISESGMDGLTADEKTRLNELSKRMRRR